MPTEKWNIICLACNATDLWLFFMRLIMAFWLPRNGIVFQNHEVDMIYVRFDQNKPNNPLNFFDKQNFINDTKENS